MSSSKHVNCVRAAVAAAMSLATLAHATTVGDIAETTSRVKALEARVAERKAAQDLEKLGGTADAKTITAPSAGASKTASTERTIDDGVTLLSVTGPSSNPTYLIQYRGVPIPMKVGGDSIDGWQLDAVQGNRLLLVRREGKKQQVVERKTVTMSDLSYARQREQQRQDEAKAASTTMMNPMMGMPMAPPQMPMANAQDPKTITP